MVDAWAALAGLGFGAVLQAQSANIQGVSGASYRSSFGAASRTRRLGQRDRA
jgi:hypothetical protein